MEVMKADRGSTGSVCRFVCNRQGGFQKRWTGGGECLT